MRAVIYVRVSSVDQVEGTSLESQEQACRDYAHRHNMDIAQVFVERGESAKFADRTQLLELLTYCKNRQNDVSMLLVWKLDRFARNVEDHFVIKANLRRCGVSVMSVTEPIAQDANGKLLETILAGFAAFDNDVRSMRSIQGMQQRLREGIFPWKPPLGYLPPRIGRKTEPDRPDPATFGLLKKAWELYATGTYTKRAIVRLLADWGALNERRRPITAQQIDHMFQNQFYAGIVRDPWTGAEYQGRHAAMISRELFARVQDVIVRRGNSHPHHIPHTGFPVRGLARCPTCDHPLTGALTQGRTRKYGYYNCYFRDCPTRTRSYPADPINAEFAEYLQTLSVPEAVSIAALTAIRANLSRERAAMQDARRATAKVVAGIERELTELVAMRTKRLVSDDEFLKQRARLQRQQETQRAKVTLRPDQWLTDAESARIAKSLANVSGAWTTIWPEQRRGFERLVFPTGYVIGRIRTAESGLLFSVFASFRAGVSNGVQLRPSDLNQLCDEIRQYLRLIAPGLPSSEDERQAA